MTNQNPLRVNRELQKVKQTFLNHLIKVSKRNLPSVGSGFIDLDTPAKEITY